MADSPYASLAQFKTFLGETTSTADDTALTEILEDTSRHIDNFTHRRFWIDDAAVARVYLTSQHLYRTDDGDMLCVEDIGATTGLVVETWDDTAYSTVASSDYELYPESAITLGKAATGILFPTLGLSVYRKIRITAKWGWPSVPKEVRRACLLHASRLVSRSKSPSGSLGDATWGIVRIPFADPDVKALLYPLVKPLVA